MSKVSKYVFLMSGGQMKGVRAISCVDGAFQRRWKLKQGEILDLPSRVGADRLKIRDVEQVVARDSKGRASLASRSYFIALSRPFNQLDMKRQSP